MAMSDASYTDQGFESGDGRGDPSSPLEKEAYGFSRCSSTGSLNTLSSAHNTDDEDSAQESTPSYKERRREAHTHAEQKRRDSIKRGYNSLQELVPNCHTLDSVSGYKLSKATILQRSIDYIQYLIKEKKKQEEEMATLKKEVVALQIMMANYKQLVRAHHNTPTPQQRRVPEQLKFQVFQALLENLYQSFNRSVSMNSFAELSGCIFTWLEEYCKPQCLRELMAGILQDVARQHEQQLSTITSNPRV